MTYIYFIGFLINPVLSHILFKCSGFQEETSSGNLKIVSGEDADVQNGLLIPGHLMSHFKSVEFRIAFGKLSTCNMSDEIIKINLTDPHPLNSNTTTFLLESIMEVSSDILINDSHSYEPFVRSNNSYDQLMYSVGNVTIESDKNNSAELEPEPMCNRKLNRKDVHFTPAGFLFYSGEYYRPSEYCIQAANDVEEWVIIRKCHIDCNDLSTPCVPLCCHLHEFTDLDVGCCQASHNSQSIFQPMVYADIDQRLSLEEVLDTTLEKESFSSVTSSSTNTVRPHYIAFSAETKCVNGRLFPPIFFNDEGFAENTKIHVQNNGKVAYIGSDREWHFMDNFCVAGVVNGYEEHKDMTSLIQYCFADEMEPPREVLPHYLYIGSYSFSAIFLLLTASVYILLWEKQNIHGWTILSFVVSQFFMFVLLAITHALGIFTISEDDNPQSFYCTGSGILAHFFFLSTFSWLTIINLDLWWTFKSLTPLSERSKGKKRFVSYMIFAWGIPTITITTGLVLKHVYSENSTRVIVPEYGTYECFLARHAKGVYLYYILGTLQIVNVIFISLTFITIYNFKKSTRMATSSSSKNKERSFKLFVKLVIVMGFTWILELVVWIENSTGLFSWQYVAIDLLNILQGIGIFLIFVCKRKILNQLEQKHPCLRVITKPLLRLMTAKPLRLGTSTDSKQTGSTAMTSSVVQNSRKQSQKPTTSDCKL